MPAEQRVRTNEERLPAPAAQNPAGRREKTRSLSSSCGREPWRRRTASSCRSTTISSSLNSRERSRSAATASACRNNRYSNDTTKKRPPSTRTEKKPTLRWRNEPRWAPSTARWIYAPHADSHDRVLRRFYESALEARTTGGGLRLHTHSTLRASTRSSSGQTRRWSG